MSSSPDITIIGAGFGGLAAAMALSGRGHRVRVLEAADRPGGKCGVTRIDGVAVDTGPTLLPLPFVAQRVFELGGARLADELALRAPDPACRYRFSDGTWLDTFADRERTLAEVRRVLGPAARDQLSAFLAHAEHIWSVSAPPFLFGDAPSVRSMLGLDVRTLWRLRGVDATTTMWKGIRRHVSDRRLVALLARFAQYSGSDVRAAPGVLNCVAHIEFGGPGVGAVGVEGGMGSLVAAMVRVIRRNGGEILTGKRVTRVDVRRGAVAAVETSDGSRWPTRVVVSNAEAAHLFDSLLAGSAPRRKDVSEPSLSCWTALFKASPMARRAPRTVLLGADPLAEAGALFDRHTVAAEPSIEICDQTMTHGRVGWMAAGGADARTPVLAVVHMPPLRRGESAGDHAQVAELRATTRVRLIAAGLLADTDPIVWERAPADLARRFPGSNGSIYGAASNTAFAAFARPGNRHSGVKGLYLASGSAHPGGGVPLCLLSGVAAARAILADHGAAERDTRQLRLA